MEYVVLHPGIAVQPYVIAYQLHYATPLGKKLEDSFTLAGVGEPERMAG